MDSNQGLYAAPMLYDILYTPGTAAEVTALERVEARFARQPLADNRIWFEPACGTGRYLRVAAGRGRRCLGFDIDTGQIDYARRRTEKLSSRNQQYFLADMKKFMAEAAVAGLPNNSVDFAFNPVNSIRHLESDRDMLAHLNQIGRILKPGAIYIVGISITDYDWLMAEEDLWEASRGKTKVSQLINFLPPEMGTRRHRIETAISHLTVTRPRGQEHFDDTYDLRTYGADQWQELIEQSTMLWGGSFDAWGKELKSRVLPYQLEVLVAPE